MSVLLIAHGSPDPRHRSTMQTVAEELQEQIGRTTSVGFLDHNEPTVSDALTTMITDAPGNQVDTVGMFMSDGYHTRVDLPSVLAEGSNSGSIRDRGTLEMGTWVLPALERRLAEAGSDGNGFRDAVVLMAAGSSRLEAREQVTDLARTWQHARGVPVVAGFASGPGVSVTVAMYALDNAGYRHRSVAQLMLAPGVLSDRVTDIARAHGARVTEPLAAAPEVIARIVDLIAE